MFIAKLFTLLLQNGAGNVLLGKVEGTGKSWSLKVTQSRASSFRFTGSCHSLCQLLCFSFNYNSKK